MSFAVGAGQVLGLLKEFYDYGKFMHVSFPIPKELESYIESQLQSGNYTSAGEYFLALVQHDRQHKEGQARLASLLQEGLESETELVTPEYWQDLRRSILGSGQ